MHRLLTGNAGKPRTSLRAGRINPRHL